jgi:predicted RNA binding protein YcfA (HicA-like mRNA interferase family)
MKARDVIAMLKADGWYEVPSKGGHMQLRHPTKPGRVTVPVHGGRDLQTFVVASIERQSRLKIRRR